MIYRFVVTNNGEARRCYDVVPDYDKKEFIVNGGAKEKMKDDFEIIEEKCEICTYFDSQGNAGHCRRFPPIPDGNAQTSIDEPPFVKESGWCGEYKSS